MAVVKYDGVDVHIDSKIILEDVSFTLEAGEFAYIIGKVGSGKSTLLKTIYGEVPVVDGDAYVFDDFNLRNISMYVRQANTSLSPFARQGSKAEILSDVTDFSDYCADMGSREE